LKEDGEMAIDYQAIEDTRDKARWAYECGQTLSEIEEILIGNRDVWTVYLQWAADDDYERGELLEEFLFPDGGGCLLG